ncbi:DUF2145 domain-containing protein [Thalassotalea mangrovi]|uniref:DUF2145 domain-containing protein n=1 Tax=Thalassotalea mangrovi TaxID=2572245 RepID=A0A4U1BAP1_9GAMM|nr:DUF2145 domain-containing protein [Thalassotalea mangrovi]TKB47857.1 DUF2145 domain-containing protein [Thalassotalea mangrovi]
MFKLTRIKSLALGLIVSLSIGNCWAGSASPTDNQHDVEVLKSFAKNVEQYAAKQGARAFIIGRIGRPESQLPDGVTFTHAAIAIYSEIQLDNGDKAQGYAVHNLYQKEGDKSRSELVTDYPIDFFWGVHQLKAGIIIPKPELQQRLIATIARGDNVKVHNPQYSVMANPFNDQYQNCTEHTLDVINASIYQTTDKAKLKANAKAYFQPQRIKTSPIALMFGSAFMKDLTMKDHSGKIYTATFTSIARYLNNNNLISEAVLLNENGIANPLL